MNADFIGILFLAALSFSLLIWNDRISKRLRHALFCLHEVETENNYIKTHELSTLRGQIAKLTALVNQCTCESKLPIQDAPGKPRLVSQKAAFEHGAGNE